ncbi:hypothetical protein OSTOST_07980 [Ostertagia ostertagi]
MEALMDETCLFFRQTADQDAYVTFVQSATTSAMKSSDECFPSISRGVTSLAISICTTIALRNVLSNANTAGLFKTTAPANAPTDSPARGKSPRTSTYLQGVHVALLNYRCERLAKEASFTDRSCGVVEVEGDGVVTLSTYPGPRPKVTFCQWLLQSSDPWAVIEVDIERLGLDGEDIRPGSVCNDLFTAFGEQELVGPIPCDGSQNVTKLRSKSNWLLLELRSDPYSESSVSGPRLRHGLKRMQPGVRIYSEGMTSSTLLPSIAAIALALAVVRIF